jgi:D-lactate dehydrogenase (cytochrome)
VSDGERPFYLQLQESIHERVQKEKAEQLEIQSLQQRTARGKFWATITGMGLRRIQCMNANHHQLSPSPAPWATTMAS